MSPNLNHCDYKNNASLEKITKAHNLVSPTSTIPSEKNNASLQWKMKSQYMTSPTLNHCESKKGMLLPTLTKTKEQSLPDPNGRRCMQRSKRKIFFFQR
jgi:hypothetical protein